MQSPDRIRKWTIALAFFSMATLGINAQTQSGYSENNSSKKVITFEVFSIKPSAKGKYPSRPTVTADGFTVTSTMFSLIEMAYNPMTPRYWDSKNVLHAPSWTTQDLYSIDARVAAEDLATWQRQDGSMTDTVRGALQAALRDRCNLTVKVTQTEVPYLDLVVGKHGAKLSASMPNDVKPSAGASVLGKGFYYERDSERHYVGVSMDELASQLMRFSRGSLIQNKTSLEGRYNFTLPFYDQVALSDSDTSSPPDRTPLNSIGLTLRPGMGPSFILDIESIRMPDAN